MKTPISFSEFFESIWLKIPEVWRSADAENGRPLQILTYTMAQHMYYYFYKKIVSMDELFDIDKCPDKYLKFLASILNWTLIGNDPVSWRQQLRHAPFLYKIKGTEKSVIIAEKLIGYSVFMTQLYRDSSGNFVPKEKIFNSLPLNITTKPWFRKSIAPDLTNSIFNSPESDLFYPYNDGDVTFDSLGNTLVKKQLKKSKQFTITLSTLPTYDPLSGANSLARFAKIPRLNVILKKDDPLDFIDPITKKSTEVNIEAALDLLLQFKPFHVFINDLEVRYDLSDYILGYDGLFSAGLGEGSSDTILNRELSEIDIGIPDFGEDRLHYGQLSNIIRTYPVDISENEIVISTIILATGTPIKLLATGSLPSNLFADNIYYILPGSSSTHYKLADCKENLFSNIPVAGFGAVSSGSIVSIFLGNCLDDSLESIIYPNDTASYNKGLLRAEILSIPLLQSNSIQVRDTHKLSSLGFSLDGYALNDILLQGKEILSYSNIVVEVDSTDPSPVFPDPVLTEEYINTLDVPFSIETYSNIKASSYQPNISIYTFEEFSLKNTLFQYNIVDLSSYFGKIKEQKFVPLTTVDVKNIILNSLNKEKDKVQFYFPDSYVTMKVSDSVFLTQEFPVTVTINSSAKTFTRASGTGSFIDEGFVPGQTMTVSGYDKSGNNSSFIITNVTSNVITASGAVGLVNESAPKVITQSYLNNNPWDLYNLTYFSSFGLTKPGTGLSGTPLNTEKILFNNLLTDGPFILDLTFVDPIGSLDVAHLYLLPGRDYKIDFMNKSIILNTKEIIKNRLQIDLESVYPDTTANYLLKDSKITILFINKIAFNSDTTLINRKRKYSINKRNHKEFSRVFWLSDSTKTLRETASPTLEYIFDTSTGQLVPDYVHSKLFKQDLSRIYTRNSLHKEVIDNTTAVTYDLRSPRDTSKWIVNSELFTSTYLGPELVGKNFWGNYFNAPFPISGTTIPYSSVDTSFDSQESNRNSLRWQQIRSTIDTKNPDHFLVTRQASSDRNNIWTRGSAAKMPLPYKGYTRTFTQGLRSNLSLFNRTEQLPDYIYNSQLPQQGLSKYKYIESTNGVDATISWFNPTIEQVDSISPEIDNRTTDTTPAILTTVVSPSTLNYPILSSLSLGYTPKYQYAFDFTDRNKYYISDSSNVLSPSLYAGNLVINSCPYEGNLLNETTDTLDMSISGLSTFEDIYIASSTDREFLFSHNNLFIVWRQINTGDTVNIGYFPLIDSAEVVPSVRVYKNGIQLAYDEIWHIASDYPRIVFEPSVVIASGDIIRIVYDTINGVPVSNLPYNATPTTRYIEYKTLTPSDFTSRQINVEFAFSNNPVVSWFRADTAQFINYNLMINTTDELPYPISYKLLAVPDLTIKINGFILQYRQHWDFIYYPLAFPMVRIRFFSYILEHFTPGDTISVEYTGL